jgi:hypothetical protein
MRFEVEADELETEVLLVGSPAEAVASEGTKRLASAKVAVGRKPEMILFKAPNPPFD